MKRSILISSCIVVFVIGIGSAQTPVTPQMKAMAKRLVKACEARDIQACFDLAHMHWQGKVTGWCDNTSAVEVFKRGIVIDKEKAVAEQHHACDGGEADGCYNLAVMYANGLGVPKEYVKADELFGKACDGGNAAGCYNHGIMYANGRGVTKNEVTAAKLFQKACEGGNAKGCNNLGFMYRKGIGVAKNEAKAAEFVRKACDGGDALGCNNLGHAYMKGEGVTKDEVKAVELFQKGCEGGETKSCNNINYLFMKACKAGNAESCLNGGRWTNRMRSRKSPPKGTSLEERSVSWFFREASKLLHQACDGGDLRGCSALGEMYEKGEGVVLDGARAAQLLQQACDGGLTDVCLRLAHKYRNPRFDEHDPIKARAMFTTLCSASVNAGCRELADIYLIGEWVLPDRAKALALLKQACDCKDDSACRQLKSEQDKPTPMAAATTAPVTDGGAVRGVVVGSDGKPATGVGLTLCRMGKLGKRQRHRLLYQRVKLHREGGGDSGFLWVGATKQVALEPLNITPVTTDATGAFVIVGVPQGDYAISPLARGAVMDKTCAFSVEEDGEEELPLRVKVEKGRPTDVGRVMITSKPSRKLREQLRRMIDSI